MIINYDDNNSRLNPILIILLLLSSYLPSILFSITLWTDNLKVLRSILFYFTCSMYIYIYIYIYPLMQHVVSSGTSFTSYLQEILQDIGLGWIWDDISPTIDEFLSVKLSYIYIYIYIFIYIYTYISIFLDSFFLTSVFPYLSSSGCTLHLF